MIYIYSVVSHGLFFGKCVINSVYWFIVVNSGIHISQRAYCSRLKSRFWQRRFSSPSSVRASSVHAGTFKGAALLRTRLRKTWTRRVGVTCSSMASWISSGLCPDLKELEKKIGRKTPESLVVSIRDHAVDCDEKGDHNDIDNDNDSFSEKIKHLRREMRCLRRADVQILWQLVAVHEGLEALRWLEEERTLASGSSSLTGSQSSLGTAEGACWPSLTPSRNSPVGQDSPPECSPPREEPAGVLLSPDSETDQVANQKGQSLPKPNIWSEEAGSTLGPPGPERGVRDLRWGIGPNNRTRSFTASPDPGKSDTETLPKPYSQVSGQLPTPLQDYKNNSQAIRKALDSSDKKRPKDGSGGGLAPTNHKGETKKQGNAAKDRVQRNCGRHMGEDKLSVEEALFGYDAQWCWVESQDDVTFL